MKNISRRSFLKGSVGTGAALGLGLLGVSSAAAEDTKASAAPLDSSTAVEVKPVSVVQGEDHTYGSFLNPQEDFTGDSGDMSAIFSPLKIGGVTLKNRLVKSSAGSEMQKDDFWPSDTALEYYGAFAKGGIGMICYESSNQIPGSAMGSIPPGMPGMPDMDGMPDMGGMPADGAGAMPAALAGIPAELLESGFAMHQLDISTDEGISAHKAIADYMHQFDVPVIAQMMDMMMMTGGGGSYAKSEKLETSMNPGIMQSTEAVQAERDAFIAAGIRYWKAGFDGVEINCSCNHYFSTFLSRVSNHERTDQYSGDTLENRCRIVTEIIEGIRKETGDDFIIQVLYSGVEEQIATLGDNDQCITIDEACGMAELFEKAGASSLHIRSQAYGHHCAGFMPDVLHMFEHGDTGYGSVIDYKTHFSGCIDGKHQGYGALIGVAAKIKEHVSIPVGAVGAMDPAIAPDFFNNAIRDGKIDFLMMTRPLMADMNMPKKLQENRREEIAPCTRCMTCFVAPFGMGTPMYCRVNPALTRAFTDDMPEGYDPLPAETPKRVTVIGGGPAGMEAARIAAERGHQVTLLEKNDVLGGKLQALQILKGGHERIEDYRKYLIRQMGFKNVDVKLGVEATVDTVKSTDPEVVIVAVGGQVTGDFTAAGILNMDDLCACAERGEALTDGEEVIILGAQFQACEIAANLIRAGKRVTMVNPGSKDERYRNGTTWSKMMGNEWLNAKGVKVYNNASIQQADATSVTFGTEFGMTLTLKADAVIQALPMEANRALFDALADICDEVYAVGDCYSPNTIANATARANIIARKAGNGATAAAAALAENQYTATATGIGDVRVTLTVEDGKIVDALVDTSNETAGIGRDLGEAFARQIVENGDIDVVTGSTVTTDAVRKALASCLEQAGL